MTEKRIAIMGEDPAAIIIGAWLARSGLMVDLISPYKTQVSALQKSGVTVTGSLDIQIPIPLVAYMPDQMKGIYDIVFLLCEPASMRSFLDLLDPFLSQNSVVCILQNGVPEFPIKGYHGIDRIVGGLISINAEWDTPGVIRCTSPVEHLLHGILIDLGELDGRITSRLLTLKDILAGVGLCTVSQDLLGSHQQRRTVTAPSFETALWA